ncbi:MAG TPA: FkbM family methyltransferase [Candidatus Paceibacterota bacterium]
MYNTRLLDYSRNKLFIFTENIREFETRARSCAKEPELIEWIERFPQLTIFYDIGANVGAYSLVAAVNSKKVFSFEPAFQNFFRLNSNVSLNHLDNVVTCFPVALSTHTKLGSFKYIETSAGSSKGFYNEDAKFHLVENVEIEKQMLVFSLDDFIQEFNLPTPHMIKIDVDGGEMDVITGARKTLTRSSLKSVLVEIDSTLNDVQALINLLESAGLTLDGKFRRTDTISNYIFVRE